MSLKIKLEMAWKHDDCRGF